MKGEGAACCVILKRVQMPPEDERRQRAVEEVRLATRLHHPGIAEVYGLDEHEGTPYVVLEHSPGIFLATAMETELLVHRAVSPTSIRLELSGRVTLTDFGVAYSRMVGWLDTPSKVLRAELAYAAPEVMRRQKPDGRADLYSLGMVPLEMVSGQYPLDPPDVNVPYSGSSEVSGYNARVRPERPTWTSAGALANRILSFGPDDVERVAAQVPEPLKCILHKALHAYPDDRYQTAGEMRDELRAWLSSQGKSFRLSEAAAELGTLLRGKPPRRLAHSPSRRRT